MTDNEKTWWDKYWEDPDKALKEVRADERRRVGEELIAIATAKHETDSPPYIRVYVTADEIRSICGLEEEDE